jgi:hypothetical protein
MRIATRQRALRLAAARKSRELYKDIYAERQREKRRIKRLAQPLKPKKATVLDELGLKGPFSRLMEEDKKRYKAIVFKRWAARNKEYLTVKSREYSREYLKDPVRRAKHNERTRRHQKVNAKKYLARRMVRYNNDPAFNAEMRLRARTKLAFKSWMAKNCRYVERPKTRALLGCTFSFFKSYIETRFKGGMTWAAFMRGEIHLDHVKPCAEFDLSDPRQQRECFHYTNYQPLWATDNCRKSSKFERQTEMQLVA